jgi:hypothetical protein
MHYTLTPRFNRRLLAAWGAVVLAVAVCSWSVSLPDLALGAALGVALGSLQKRAMEGSSETLIASSTAMDVRRALTSNSVGRRYIWLLWASFATLPIMALISSGRWWIISWAGGVAVMSFVRELITLRTTVRLAALEAKGAPAA